LKDLVEFKFLNWEANDWYSELQNKNSRSPVPVMEWCSWLFSLPLSTHDNLTECLEGDKREGVNCNGQVSHTVWGTALHDMEAKATSGCSLGHLTRLDVWTPDSFFF